jgi:hypothetical protein
MPKKFYSTGPGSYSQPARQPSPRVQSGILIGNESSLASAETLQSVKVNVFCSKPMLHFLGHVLELLKTFTVVIFKCRGVVS